MKDVAIAKAAQRPGLTELRDWPQAAGTAERLLRWSLGVVYFWFGGLKLVGMSPVLELLRRTYPPFATLPLYLGLALFELVLGVLLVAGLAKRWTSAAAILHLTGTLGVLFSAPHTAFLPRFPFLTMEGEFVVKNLVLIAAAAALWLMAQKETAVAQARYPRLVIAFFVTAAAGLGLAAPYLHQSLRVAAQRSASALSSQAQVTAAQLQWVLDEDTGSSLTVEGWMVDHCRLLGCWLRLRDHSGELLVDLAPSGLSARTIPLGSQIRVQGRIGKTREGAVGFVASGLKLLETGKSL